MELRRDGVMRWQDICVQLALGMGGFSYVRIVNYGQNCVPVLLTFLQKTEKITCAANIFSNLESFQCVCGRTFRRKGDLSRHRNFCRGSNLLLV